jgi:hypothetical protein
MSSEEVEGVSVAKRRAGTKCRQTQMTTALEDGEDDERTTRGSSDITVVSKCRCRSARATMRYGIFNRCFVSHR